MRRCFTLLLALLFLLAVSPAVMGEEAKQILLLGTDRLGYRVVSEQEDLSRADAIFILSVPEGGKSLRLLSVERDYMVNLPDGSINKLSTTTYFGGSPLTLDTVNSLFDLNIRHYMQIDIPSAILAIDAMGGVDVMVYEEELAVVNRSPIIEPKVSAGINHFDGKKAQAFMRVRDLGAEGVQSNSQRNNRQMRVLSAMLEKASTLGIRQAGKLATQVLPLIRTNMTMYDLLLLLKPAMASIGGSGTEMAYGKSPLSPYALRRANMHQVVIVEDMAEEIRLVHAFLNQ